MKIEILGVGCAKCKNAEKIVRKVAEELGIDVDIVKIEDLEEIVNRGVMMTPAVFINGEMKIVGRVPDADELKELLKK
jgi:small redox-active disulfide protein 2